MSTVKANDLMKVDGGIPTVKGQRLIPTAWVNFNGTSTVAIRDSENVSSITDRGTGIYTINYSTAMSTANVCAAGSAAYDAADFARNRAIVLVPYSTSSTYANVWKHDGTATDALTCMVTILGGQA